MISLYIDEDQGYLDVSVPVEVRKRIKAIANEINWGGQAVVLGIERQVGALEAVARATAEEKRKTLYPGNTNLRGEQASRYLRSILSWLTANDCIPRWSLEAEDLMQPYAQKLVSGQFPINLSIQLFPSRIGGRAGVIVTDWDTGTEAYSSLNCVKPKENDA